jgi:hypothetical protein
MCLYFLYAYASNNALLLEAALCSLFMFALYVRSLCSLFLCIQVNGNVILFR